MTDLSQTKGEFLESLPETFEEVIRDFIQDVSRAVSITEVNLAAGIALQRLEG